MSVQNPALFLDGESHPAEDVRRWVHALAGNKAGRVGSGDFAVSQKGTPNMSVDVAAGRAYVAGDEATYQGLYFVENRGVVNLAVSAADATNPRKDLVVLQVEDSTYSGATDAASLAVVTGTPAASPVEPTVPDNALVLALVDVAANETTILSADITDRRTNLASSLGGVTPTTASTRPASPRAGDPIYEQDTGNFSVWTGLAWSPLAFSTDVAQAVPPGVGALYFLPGAAPTGWLELLGQTIVGADVLHPDLWGVAPAGWKSGSDLTLPNMQGQFPVGVSSSDSDFDLEDTGGAKTRTLTVDQIPAHQHGMSHFHDIEADNDGAHYHTANGSLTVNSSGAHTHNIPFNTNPPFVYKASPGFGESIGTGIYDGALEFVNDGDVFSYSSMQSSGSHAHDVEGATSYAAPSQHGHSGGTTSQDVTQTDSGTGVGGSSVNMLPPYFAVRFLIKA